VTRELDSGRPSCARLVLVARFDHWAFSGPLIALSEYCQCSSFLCSPTIRFRMAFSWRWSILLHQTNIWGGRLKGPSLFKRRTTEVPLNSGQLSLPAEEFPDRGLTAVEAPERLAFLTSITLLLMRTLPFQDRYWTDAPGATRCPVAGDGLLRGHPPVPRPLSFNCE
jgi:hypothetical protein